MSHGRENIKVFKAALTNGDESTSSSSEDDEDAELLTEDLEKGFFKVLGQLKKKDPKIYEENAEFYSIGQNGKKERLDKNYKKWLRGKKIKVSDSELKKELGALHDVWTDPNLSQDDQFLRDYILNEKFLECDESFNVEKELDELSEEEKELQEQLQFEEKYNCRFEKPDEEFLKKYPHSVGKSVEKKRKGDGDSQLKVKKIKKDHEEIDRAVKTDTSKHKRKSKKKAKRYVQNEVQQIGTKINIKSGPDENEVQRKNGEEITIKIKSEPGENVIQWENRETTTIKIKSEPSENEMQWENRETTIKIKSEPGENEMQNEIGKEMRGKNESIENLQTLAGKSYKRKRKRKRNSQIKIDNIQEDVESNRKDELKRNKQNKKSTSKKFLCPAVVKVEKFIKEESEQIQANINIKSKPHKKKMTEKNGGPLNQENILDTNQHTLAKPLKNKRNRKARASGRTMLKDGKAEIDKNSDPVQSADQREKVTNKEEPKFDTNQHTSSKSLKNKRKRRNRALRRKMLKEIKTEADKNSDPIQCAEQRKKMANEGEPQVKKESKQENNSKTLIENNINVTRKKIKKQKKRETMEKYSTKHKELVNKNLNELIIKEGFSLEKMIPRRKIRHRVLKALFPDKFDMLQKSKNQGKPLQENGMKKKEGKTPKSSKHQENK